jgi:hypothetical protein
VFCDPAIRPLHCYDLEKKRLKAFEARLSGNVKGGARMGSIKARAAPRSSSVNREKDRGIRRLNVYSSACVSPYIYLDRIQRDYMDI